MSSETEKSNDLQSFSARLKQARKIRRLTQEELAQRASMPTSSIAHFEIGSRKPSFDTLRRLAETLEITTDFLLGLVENPNLTQTSDPLFRHAENLTAADREIAEGFFKMLSQKNKKAQKIK